MVTEKLVPVMSAIYILACLAVVLFNITEIPRVFGMIFQGAFSPEAVTGGAAGIGVKLCITWGVKRGVFSNEAGLEDHAHDNHQNDGQDDVNHVPALCGGGNKGLDSGVDGVGDVAHLLQ